MLSQIKRKFIGDNEVAGEKIRLDNDQTLRAKSATTGDVDLLKLDTDDILQFLALPRVPSDPTDGNDVARKSYVDDATTAITDTIGQPDGIAPLGADNKVPVIHLPFSLMQYQGVWDASTNTPALADYTDAEEAAEHVGDTYRVNVSAIVDLGSGPIKFAVGDYVICNALGKWERSPGVEAKYPFKERITIIQDHLDNQWVDLTYLAEPYSMMIVIGGVVMEEGVDYTLSVNGFGNTRIEFINDLATGGVAALEVDDVLRISCRK